MGLTNLDDKETISCKPFATARVSALCRGVWSDALTRRIYDKATSGARGHPSTGSAAGD